VKHFGLDWGAFLQGLEGWGRLSPVARKVFLDRLAPNLAVKATTLGGSAHALTSSGLLAAVGDGSRFRIAEPYLPLLRGLRALERVSLFDDVSLARLEKYLAVHFSVAECAALTAQWLPYGDRRQTAERVSQPEWLEEFRQASDLKLWESRRSGAFEFRSFAQAGVAAALRAVIDRLLARSGAWTLADLVRSLPELPRPVLGQALYVGIRYLLLFPALRPADLEPVVGLWPSVVQRPAEPVAPTPEPVEPEETCSAGFALEDMITVLAACMVEPPRLRSNDLALFARARETLIGLLSPLPEWVEEVFTASPVQRIERAARILRLLDFVEVGNDEAGRPQLAATRRGREWIERPAKERVKGLLDPLKTPVRRHPEGAGLNFLPYDWPTIPSREFDEPAAIVTAFQDLPVGVFFDLVEFLRHRSTAANPLLALARSGKRYHWLPGVVGQIEQLWTRRLLGFFGDRLTLFGGVRLGRSGTRISFALTDVGQYLLDQVSDFTYAEELAAEVVVQPNFDVVFLTPSIPTEAALGRFAERLGTGVGTLFRITRRSVLTAAATGLTAEQAFATLRQAAAKGIPDNVAREIAGWFGQCRRITLRPAVLLHCPDVETARRVLATGGKSVMPLSDTVVELHEPQGKTALLRKLREVGVFASE
jgi:hypothetical protein